MKFTLIDNFGDEKVLYTRTPEDTSLGEILHGHLSDVHSVEVNNEFVEAWQIHKVQKHDQIKLYLRTGEPSTVALIISAVISIISTILSIVLAPSPLKPKASKSQPSVGVAGIQNTIAPGTPKFLPYGTRRVFGHLIASYVDVSPDDTVGRPDSSRKMTYSSLYFMGVGKIASISEVKLNNTNICDIFGPPKANVRLGTPDQTIIPRHELVHQTYYDGRPIEIPIRKKKQRGAFTGRTLTYTTKGNNVNKVTLMIEFSQGIWKYKTTGPGKNYFVFKIKRKRNSESAWTELGEYQTITSKDQIGFFWKIELEMPDADQWDIQINYQREKGKASTNQAPQCSLFNIVETKYITTAYPGNALLEINGIANDQISSFDNMSASALVQGRLVDVLVNGVYVKQFSRNRVWIIRDILFNADVGLGHRLHSSLWDNAAGLAAANYYEELIQGYSGLEQRDYCDVILNDAKPGWDHVKNLLFEGRASIFPSGGKLKYVLDKDIPPGLLYSSPGNILNKGLQLESGSSEKPINTLQAEFPDIESDYKVVPAKLVSEDKEEDEPERLDTLSIASIVRKSQVSRLMNYRLKSINQIKKRWIWKSPQSAVVSEPLDVAWLSYNVSKNLRGYNGFIKGSSHTKSQFVADRSVYLAVGNTYSAFIRHLNTVEDRILSNTPGTTYSIFNLESALSFTPEEGDIWAIGKTDTHVEKVQIDSVEFDGETFILKAHEHLPEIYEDALSDITGPEGVGVTQSVIPLLDAQAVPFGSAGVTQGYLFNVVPGFSALAGTYSILGDTSVTLSADEVDRDDYFNDAYIIADLDPAIKIIDYDGDTKVATVNSSFVAAVTQSGVYSISWPLFETFGGFTVEGLGGLTWTEIDTVLGTTLTVITAATYSQFRFTPVSINEVENTNAQITVEEGRVDLTPPFPPLAVYASTDPVRTGTVTVDLLRPLDRDIQYVEVEFLSNLTEGDTFLGDVLDVSGYRNELEIESPLTVTVDVDLASFEFGTIFTARASTLDFFGNRSSWVPSFNSITLSSVDTPPPEDDVIPTEGATVGVTSGAGIIALFEDTVDGGTITGDQSLRLDLNVLVSPGSTQTTTVDFHYAYAGATASIIEAQIANGSDKIDADTPYWLTFLLSPEGNDTSQNVIAKKTGEEVPSNDVTTDTALLHADASLDQVLGIYAFVTGDTATEFEVINATLTVLTGEEPSSVVTTPFFIHGSIPGRPARNITIQTVPFVVGVSFGTNMVTELHDSYAYAGVAPTSDATFTLKKNNATFGTMTFSSGLTNATFISTQSYFTRGDIFTMLSPDPADPTLADIGWGFYGVRE